MFYRSRYLLVTCLLSFSCISYAHQPVMDMAPRWDEGYGFQIQYETYGSDTRLDGSSKIDNSLGLERFVSKTWFEGVYTFNRAIRITLKVPYVEQTRIKDVNGTGVKQKNSGIGNIIIAVPIKKYINLAKSTGNISFTPSLRLPTGSTSGNFPLGTGSVDLGLSVAYSKSTPKTYQLYDLFYWINNKGVRGMQAGNELGLDINVGIHPYHNNATNSGMFLIWDITARHQNKPSAATLTTASGGDRISTGPVIVFYRESVMFRAEYRYPVYEKKRGIGLSRGDGFQLGIGMTF